MSRLVVLSESSSAVPVGYDVRLGPLAFVTPADTVSETIGDGLEAVGAGLVAGERRPRPLKLKLPVRGYHLDIDASESGRRLRRQVRQLLDNPRWRLQGFYFTWAADEDLDGWLLVGGAELGETDPGISFGEFELDLADVYVRGRPGTHRPGRRAAIADRRSGLVSRDTRWLLYSTDFAAQALPTEPLVLPGDIVDLVATGNQPVSSVTAGPLRGARRLWRTCAASDAEIVTYRPDESVLSDRSKYIDLDSLGSVRVWDLSAAVEYPPLPASYSTERDTSPDIYRGWERVLGDVLTPDRPLAIDNGACRVIWLGAAANQGLAVEHWDEALGHYRRAGRVLHSLNVREQQVVEVTPERAVVEWRAGRYALRAILQRGWWGPRLESYDDGGSTARLEYAPEALDAATLVTALAGSNDDLAYTARTPGSGGNAITIEYVDPGAVSASLSVAVVGTAIRVSLATDAAGAVTTTATQVRDAVAAHATASGLVTVALAAGNTGAGVVRAMPATALTGGGLTVTSQTPAWVRAISGGGESVLWAQGMNDETVDQAPVVMAGDAVAIRRTRVLVAQLAPSTVGVSASQLASLSLVDARPIPVLVGR